MPGKNSNTDFRFDRPDEGTFQTALTGMINQVLKKFNSHSEPSVFTVALSGIDASGKGFITHLLEQELTASGYNVANINLDPWQHPTSVRLNPENPAENFYTNVFRWDDVFNKLIIPLKKTGNIELTAKLIRNDSDAYYDYTYLYRDINILLVEGIFLFKNEWLPHYDYKIWIDCSFEAGLQRALKRNQEGLDPVSITHDYNTYYYPAQSLHFAKDFPISNADYIFMNY